MATDLSKIKIGHSPLTNSLYIYRHGKDPTLALDKREAQQDVIAAVVGYMMHDAPKGASQVFHFSDKSYEITVKPLATTQQAGAMNNGDNNDPS